MSETPSSPLLSTTQLRGHYAGFVSRTIAFVIDLIIVTFIQIVFVLAISLVFNFLGLSSIIDVLRQTTGVGGRITTSIVLLITMIVTLLGSIFFLGLYVAISWALIGRTLGQAFLGLRVLGANGQNLKFRRSVSRAIGYLLAALPLFMGFLWVLVDDRRQGWHDKLADSIVVYDWDARMDRQVREWLRRR